MITIKNYFQKIETISISQMPDALKKGHDFVNRATQGGESLTSYEASDAIRKTIDLYLQKLNQFVSANNKPDKKKQSATVQRKGQDETDKEAIRKQDDHENGQRSHKARKAMKSATSEDEPIWVERMPEELRFIRRFVNLDGKTKSKEEILRFINSLQKAIVEKRIRKTSPYAEQIRYVQERLIQVYNSMASKTKLELKTDTAEVLKKLVGGEKVMASVGFIKRYISMNEKSGVKEKAKSLLDQINRAMEKGKISDSDPYIVEIHEIKKNLKSFISDKTVKTLKIESATLNGLEGILGCACQNLSGLGARPAIMNSMDFANMEFDTIGFTGKWLELIGDPSSNFTAMVFGKPKMGKSYLCVEFAGYLARYHGRVLYVAKEEGLDYTLQQKLDDKNVKHPNLFVASILPDDLSSFDFIFLDSVTKLGLDPDDLSRLRSQNPCKSFIFIFQSTKDGKFRGANTFQHDVDVVIEVPERGRAVQMGRFNQGGTLSIFN